MKYKYQMHTHTAPCSKCSSMTPKELINSLVDGGYTGAVITNHFYGGNTGIDRNLPWNDFVKAYEDDYYECKKIAQNFDLDIIFSIEEHLFDGLEILCYGINPQFLYDNPQLQFDRSVETWSNALHNYGALCIQAHPFRDREYIKNPRLLSAEYIDGIEVFNACNKPEDNTSAESAALQFPQFILTAGADTHLPHSVCWSGIITNERIATEKTLIKILKSGNYELIK